MRPAMIANADPIALCPRSAGLLRPRRGSGARRRRHQLRCHARTGARRRRGERLRQERDDEGDPAARRAAGTNHLGRNPLPPPRRQRRGRSRPLGRARRRHARHPRRRDRADPTGTDGRLQPGAHGRRSDHRGHPATRPTLADRSQAQPARGARHHGRFVSRRRYLDAGAEGRRLLLAALRRPASTRHDRHGA